MRDGGEEIRPSHKGPQTIICSTIVYALKHLILSIATELRELMKALNKSSMGSSHISQRNHLEKTWYPMCGAFMIPKLGWIAYTFHIGIICR